nr:hypothetical protein CFP56_68766 [Quercus suber]
MQSDSARAGHGGKGQTDLHHGPGGSVISRLDMQRRRAIGSRRFSCLECNEHDRLFIVPRLVKGRIFSCSASRRGLKLFAAAIHDPATARSERKTLDMVFFRRSELFSLMSRSIVYSKSPWRIHQHDRCRRKYVQYLYYLRVVLEPLPVQRALLTDVVNSSGIHHVDRAPTASNGCRASNGKTRRQTCRTTARPGLHAMYISLRLRSQHALELLCTAAADCLALTMASRAANTTADHHQFLNTTASAPSLRSRTPVDIVMDRPYTPTDGDGGNVKVVVRVRKFVRRGK